MQLYDLYESNAPQGVSTDDVFRMRAPIETIDIFLKLHKEAVARIIRETAVAPHTCTLYVRGNKFIVQLPPQPLGTEK